MFIFVLLLLVEMEDGSGSGKNQPLSCYVLHNKGCMEVGTGKNDQIAIKEQAKKKGHQRSSTTTIRY
jgi:hypothetical protein